MARRVFFLSDRTGITAETLGETLLTQFSDIAFNRTWLPFMDSSEKVHAAAAQISSALREEGVPPLVFSTLTDPDAQAIIASSGGDVFDLFGTFIGRLERVLDAHSSHKAGRMHGIRDPGSYDRRINALNFTLDHDDGVRVQELGQADIVLTGVSRCGKTPTCLYLAMQFNLCAANYPLTEEDLSSTVLPAQLHAFRHKLHALTIQPERLCRIREERRPNSRYASLQQCRLEVARAESLFRAEGIPYINATAISIEEIATILVQQRNLHAP
ncbi:MAG: posphoenolpyruvate synthetase regulatory kinase/phosphorylase PpsR [Chromatiales bacterium]